MTTYYIGLGHNATASYGTPDPQPKCRGLQWGRRLLAGDGLEYEDGYASQTWAWTYMSPTQLAAFNALAGLGEGTPSAKCTVYTTHRLDRSYSWYNCTILAPEYVEGGAEYDRYFYHDVQYRLIRMDRIT